MTFERSQLTRLRIRALKTKNIFAFVHRSLYLTQIMNAPPAVSLHEPLTDCLLQLLMQNQRSAHFSNGWLQDADGKWLPIRQGSPAGSSTGLTKIDAWSDYDGFGLAIDCQTSNPRWAVGEFINSVLEPLSPPLLDNSTVRAD